MQDFIEHLLKPLISGNSLGYALMIMGLIAVRFLVIINMVPFLGSQSVPGPIKIGLTIGFSLIFFPYVIEHTPATIPPFLYLLLALKEALVGFVIGFITGQIFYMVEIMGRLIDVVRAVNQIELMIPELKERSSPFGSLNAQIAIIIFLSAGFHTIFFEAILKSFQVIPPAEMLVFPFGIQEFTHHLIHLTGHTFAIGFMLAMPVGTICLLIDIGFGLLNRSAPQINAYFLSMPVKAVGGILVFLVIFSYTLQQYQQYSGELMDALMKTIRLLAFNS